MPTVAAPIEIDSITGKNRSCCRYLSRIQAGFYKIQPGFWKIQAGFLKIQAGFRKEKGAATVQY